MACDPIVVHKEEGEGMKSKLPFHSDSYYDVDALLIIGPAFDFAMSAALRAVSLILSFMVSGWSFNRS